MAKVKPPALRRTRKAPARAQSRHKSSASAPAALTAPPASEVAVDDQIMASNLSLHQLFEQQARQMIDRSDLDEEQKQNILVAMNCPCCGAGAMSFTTKLRR
jgi:3-oxoacyl-ACP reductase-like protein